MVKKANSNYFPLYRVDVLFYFSKLYSITTSKTITEYEEILISHKFIRIHKSHLINAEFVSGYVSQIV